MKRIRTTVLAATLATAAIPLAVTPASAATEEARPTAASGASADAGKGRSADKPATGLAAALTGVPAEFYPGGDWGEFDLVLENTTGKPVAGETFILTIEVNTIYPEPGLDSSLMNMQMRVDGVWLDADLRMMGRDRDVDAVLPIKDTTVAPGKTTYPIRLKFTADAPLTRFFLGPRPSENVNVGPTDHWVQSHLVAPKDPGEPSEEPSQEPSGEPSQEPSEEPSGKPDPEPSEETGSGGASGGPSGGPTPRPTSSASDQGAVPAPADTADPGASGGSGTLARTGAGASSNWALGIGGGTVALGLACLAGVAAHRRRRQG